MTIKFDIKKVEFKNLSGEIFTVLDIGKALGNFIYVAYGSGKSLHWVEIAKKIFNDEEVDLNVEELDELASMMHSPLYSASGMIKECILNYIAELKETIKNNE